MSGVPETASTVSTPPAQATAAPSVYIRPYATSGYKPVYSSPPPPIESIPPGAIVIKHVNQRRKWGRRRPRKIGLDSSGVSSQQPISGAIPQDFSPPVGESTPDVADSTSGKFITHVLTLKPGEDVAQKIMAFAHSVPRAICVLSGTGAVASVALNTSGGTMSYEGRFEITSLSGSFVSTREGDHERRNGGLAITLVSAQGRVFGGRVSGFLTAATPVQVIVGSFKVQDC